MHQLINVALIGMMGLCIFETTHRNLYECALFLGRTSFAFLLAMALFEPLGRHLADSIDLAMPYARSAVFFAIWVLVLWGFEPFALEILKDTGRKMRFNHERAGQICVGLISGLMVIGALSVNLVMLPPVEGLYFQTSSQPICNMHRAAERIYGILTLSSTDAVTLAQMDAGGHWARERMPELRRRGDDRGAEQLIQTFGERYQRDDEPSSVKAHRAQILAELSSLAGSKWQEKP